VVRSGRVRCASNCDPQDSVLLAGEDAGLVDGEAGGQSENALEGPVVDLHHEHPAVVALPAVGVEGGSDPPDAQAPVFETHHDVVAVHAGQIDADLEVVGKADHVDGGSPRVGRRTEGGELQAVELKRNLASARDDPSDVDVS
jgi:hypothetical protein